MPVLLHLVAGYVIIDHFTQQNTPQLLIYFLYSVCLCWFYPSQLAFQIIHYKLPVYICILFDASDLNLNLNKMLETQQNTSIKYDMSMKITRRFHKCTHFPLSAVTPMVLLGVDILAT